MKNPFWLLLFFFFFFELIKGWSEEKGKQIKIEREAGSDEGRTERNFQKPKEVLKKKIKVFDFVKTQF